MKNLITISTLIALLSAYTTYAVTPLCPSALDKASLKTLGSEDGVLNWKGVNYRTDNKSLVNSGLKGWSSSFMDPWAEAFGESFQDVEGKKATINCNYAYVSGLLSWGYFKANKPYIMQLLHTPDMGTSLPTISKEEYADARETLGFTDPAYNMRLIEKDELLAKYTALMAPLKEKIAGNGSSSEKKEAQATAQKLSDAYDTARFYIGKHLN